jgi:pyruvate formate lyase activating enzyme
MRIGGLQKLSLIDFPGKLAAVIFTQGCNLRCRYCHNPELVLPSCFHETIKEEDVLAFLYSRRKYLEGVVISGGEPTVQPELIPFMRSVKQMNFALKLDTNGTRPEILKEIIALQLVDFIAMDVKAPLEKYEEVTATLFDVVRSRKASI